MPSSHRLVRFILGIAVAVALLGFVASKESPPATAQDTPPMPPGQVVRIRFHGRAQLQNLAAQVDVWEVQRDAPGVDTGTLVAWVTPEQLRFLQTFGYRVTPDPARTAEVTAPRPRSPDQRRGIPGFACYRTVEETYQDLADLAAAYPNIAHLVDFGDTYDKVTPGGPAGYDLFDLVLTNRFNRVADKGKLVVLAATHARELATAELVTRFAERLVAGYGRDPDLTWLLDFNEIHIIPYGNPDGRKWAEQGYLWRKNTDNPAACGFPYYGVDLNRNASFLWNVCPGCSSGDPCSIIYRGPAPGSEPETQAFEQYLAQIFDDFKGPQLADPPSPDTNGVFLSIHSYGNLVIYPWDWTGTPAPNRDALVTLGRKFGYYNGYAVCNTSNCLYAIDGSQTDYAYGQFGVATYTFELGTAFFQSCNTFESTILPANLAVLEYAAKAAYRPYQLPAGPEVLDLQVAPDPVVPGMPLRITARADDTRYDSNGYGQEAVQEIAGARVTLDRPPWLADGPAGHLAAGDGTFDAPHEDLVGWIDTAGWLPGRHLLFVQAQDADGNWGVPTAAFVTVTAPEGLDVALAPPGNVEAAPGETAHFTVTVTNRLTVTDTYRVEPLIGDWPLHLVRGAIPAPPGGRVEIPVVIQVPSDAVVGTRGSTVIQVVSQVDPFHRAYLTLQVQVVMGPTGLSKGLPPSQVFLPFVVQN